MRIWWYFGGRAGFTVLFLLQVVALFYYINALQLKLCPDNANELGRGCAAWRDGVVISVFFLTVFLAHCTFIPLQWAKLLAKEELRNGKSGLKKVKRGVQIFLPPSQRDEDPITGEPTMARRRKEESGDGNFGTSPRASHVTRAAAPASAPACSPLPLNCFQAVSGGL